MTRCSSVLLHRPLSLAEFVFMNQSSGSTNQQLSQINRQQVQNQDAAMESAHTRLKLSVCVSLQTSLHDNNIITTLRPKITPYTVTDCINSEIHNLDKNCRICLKTVCTFPHYTLCKQQYVTKVWCRKTNKYHRLTIICRWRTAWDFGHFVVILWDRSIQTVL